MFNGEWFVKYFVVQQNERGLCLICRNNIACLKEFDIKRNYNSRHSEQYEGILGQLRVDKAHQWKMSLRGQQKIISLHKNDTQLGFNWASTLVKEQQRKEQRNFK